MIEREARCVWNAGCVLGESPVWSPADESVYFLDIKTRRLLQYSVTNGRRRTWDLPCRVSCIVLPEKGFARPPRKGSVLFLCACDEGFAWLAAEREGGRVSIDPIAEVREEHPTNRFNDGKLGPDGAFYAGTMDDSEKLMSGALYRLTPDLKVDTIERGMGIPNGPAFSADGALMYLNDSMLGASYQYRLSAGGRLTEKRLFKRFTHIGEAPDGMAVDHGGNVVMAVWGGACVVSLDRFGKIVAHIALAARNPTSVCLARNGGLYITSAAFSSLPKGSEHQDGGLFQLLPPDSAEP